MIMTTEQLANRLDDILKSIKAGDSFEGGLTYTCMVDGLAPGEFEVSGTYRVGNLDGQGGIVIMEPSKALP